MRLLDRYLLREFLVPLGYCLGGFLVFWITYNLFTDMSGFEEKHLRASDIVDYYLVTTPEMLVTVVPIAMLLALLYALTNHARHHEITAIRAAGLTLWRIAVPYFGVALVAVLALFLLNELAVPNGAERAEQIKSSRMPQAASQLDRRWQRSVVFRNDRDGRSWHIGAYNMETFEMLKPQIVWRLADGSTRVINAERAQRTNDAWVFFDVQQHVFPAGKEVEDWPALNRQPVMEMPELSETPRLIVSELKIGKLDSIKTARRAHLSISDIKEYFRLHPQPDPKRADLLRTMLHSRFAMPWTCVVVVMISIPFGAASGRRNVFVGVASSVFICFGFYVVNELSLALGSRASLAPWLAAWLPNLMFGLAGAVLIQRTR